MEIPISFNAEKFINILIQRKEEVGETQIPEIDAKNIVNVLENMENNFPLNFLLSGRELQYDVQDMQLFYLSMLLNVPRCILQFHNLLNDCISMQ
jgi:hypothetical protein